MRLPREMQRGNEFLRMDTTTILGPMETGGDAGFARRAWGACAARTALARAALLVLAFFSGVFGGALGGFAAQAQWTPLTSVNTLVANVSTEDAKSEVLPDGREKLILKDPATGDFLDRVVGGG